MSKSAALVSAGAQSAGAAISGRQPKPIRIRAARPTDASVIARFNRAMAWETEARRLSAQRVSRGVKALLTDPAKGLYFVAECDGEVIGQTLIT